MVESIDKQSKQAYEALLQRERYETAIARERAERAFLEHQALAYESQRAQKRVFMEQMEQQQESYQRTNEINNVNQAANTVTSIARQIQVLSSGRAGW